MKPSPQHDDSRSETAIVLREHGGPQELRAEPIFVGAPGEGELRVRNRAISVNFHDIYVRTGQYQTLALPGVPGIDAVGIVDQVGALVDGFAPGDRIAYIEPDYGAYSSVRLLPAARVVRIPDDLDDVAAAATILRGATVAMLLDEVARLKPGDPILVQAAAGGVGQLLCSWARHRGAFVIGTAGSTEKAAIARASGAHETILYRKEDVAKRVRVLTGGTGVRIVYDSCGAATFKGSVAALDFCAHLVLFGQSSGPVAPFSPSLLAEKSLTVSRPILFHYLRTDAARQKIIGKTLKALADGIISPVKAITLPLAEAAEAHRMIEGRSVADAIVLIP